MNITLKEDNDWKDTPTVTYEVREKFYQGHYREASDFPIPNTQYTALYLDGEKHSLNLDKPKQTHVSHYHSEKDNESLRFTYTFSEDTELTGNMNLKLWVSSNEADDIDIFAGIKN